MSKCSICGAHLDTAGACPNGWRSGHPEWPKPLPTPLPKPLPKPLPTPGPRDIPEYFSSTPAILEVLGEIRDLLRELVESHTREGK